MMTHDPDRHNRRSIRLQGHDYSQAGVYFITICTQDRACLFGDVVNGDMRLNDAGRIVQAVWYGLPNHHSGIGLDAFVVMPNHVHGVVVIGTAFVGAIHESPLQKQPLPTQSGPAHIADRRRMLLSKIIGRFKMVSAKQINVLRETPGIPVWQRNYYEHVIRNEDYLNHIRQYILDNPLRWDLDRENPVAPAAEPENAWLA